MTWEIEATDQFAEWYWGLDPHEQEAVNAAVEVLEARGPSLGRPLVAEIDTSREQRAGRVKNLKELRPPGQSIRILFAFDPRRVGILLLGGDKAGDWQGWYRVAIPEAERLYADHLVEVGSERTE